MIQKHCKVVLVAMVVVVALGTSVSIARQTGDPFVSREKVESGPVADSTSTSAAINRRIGPAHEQVLNDQTEQKLVSTFVESMLYPQIPFSEAIAEFNTKYQIQLLLDDSARDDELDFDTILDAQIQNVPLEQALELLLVKHNATFIVRSGVVHVISKDVEGDQEYFETRIFDCDALAKTLPKSIPNLKPVPAADDGEPPTVDVRSTLEKLVHENVDLDSWMYFGNGDAIVREINGKLLVRNSGQSLRETRRFLEFLKTEFVVGE